MSIEELQPLCIDSAVLGVMREPGLYLDEARYVIGTDQSQLEPTFMLARKPTVHDADPLTIDAEHVDLVVRTENDGTDLYVDALGEQAFDVPDAVLTTFIQAALLGVRRHPLDVCIEVAPNNLAGTQIIAIARMGFRAVELGESITTQQEVRVEKGALYGEEKFLGGKTHTEWLMAVDSNLDYALEYEGEHGIESATDLFEAVRIQCGGAFATAELNDEDVVDVKPEFLIKFAGCLARLSSCVSLRPYAQGSSMHPDLEGRDRNDDLFDRAIATYEEVEEIWGKGASDEQAFLVSSGLAQAYALRAKYLAKREGNLEEIPTTCGDPDISKNHKRAIEELKSAKDRITDTQISVRVDRQLSETGEWQLGDTSEHDIVPVADQLLRELVTA